MKKGFKQVNWCVKIQSALAEAEVEYKEKDSTSIDVKFKITSLDNIEKIFNIKNINLDTSIVIWTTTPWTLPSNKSVDKKRF